MVDWMDRSQNNIVSVAGSLIAAQHSQVNSGPEPVPCLLAVCCWLIFTGGRNVADVRWCGVVSWADNILFKLNKRWKYQVTGRRQAIAAVRRKMRRLS